jgi:hypothetical protein
MNEQIDPAAKAEAARQREEEARQKARKNTIYMGLGLFGAVFALLSFQYLTGNDPSLRNDDRTAQTTPQQGQSTAPSFTSPQQQSGDDGWGDDDESSGQQQPQQLPDQSGQSQGQSSPPSSGAS